MIYYPILALAVQEIGIRPNVVLGGFIFASLFIISIGWVTKGPGTKNYGRFQKRNSASSN
tara:strand:+ start:575 stop:754 length:180 start_codon:yes stop_codon:yes gene_type:complete